MATFTKICGLKDVSLAVAAAEAGADALGFVFYEKSPRAVSVAQAAKIIAALPPFVTSVALFVNPSKALVEDVIDTCSVDLLQFHGDESADFCSQFSRPYIKAVRVTSAQSIIDAQNQHIAAKGLLLDAFVKGVPGGTGVAFDWTLIPDSIQKPLVIAGGLTPDNVGELVAQYKPFAVDVSGGVEHTKGQKDLDKVRAFLRAVNVASID